MNRRRPTDDERVDAGLRRLLAQVHPRESEGFISPDDDVVRAYVEGNADETQVALVEEAMLRSAEFQEIVLLLRQAEEDFAEGAVLGRLEDVVPPMELVGKEEKVSPLLRLREWFWRPQVGYGLAAAAIVALVMMQAPSVDRTDVTSQSSRLLVGLTADSGARGVGGAPETITILPGVETVDLVLAKALPGDFLERYRVSAELRREPGGEVVARVDSLTTSYPAGDGSVYLEWALPVEGITSGAYTIEFVPIDSRRVGRVESAPLESSIQVVDLRG